MEFLAHIWEDGLRAQTVEEHCRNVSAMAGKLGKKIGLAHMCQLIGLYHDAGKLCHDFQMYIRGESAFGRGQIDHSYAGAKYLQMLCKEISPKMGKLCARVICAHHGLQDWLQEDGQSTLKFRTGKEERWDEIYHNIQTVFHWKETQELLQQAAEEYNVIQNKLRAWVKEQNLGANERGVARGFYLQFLERMVLSVLVAADRTDTADSEAGKSLQLQYDKAAVFAAMQVRMEQKCQQFSKKTDHISRCRQDISQRCLQFSAHKVGICRLVVPTGGGKTLSSMRFAIASCCREQERKDHIFYIAPFMSILEQNSDTIRELVGDDRVFLEHHSDILQGLSDSNELQQYELRTDRWDSPVISTTLVQLLNTLFSKQMTSVGRMHQLCNSVIILDEVQSVPLKCLHLFQLAMNFLAQFCNTTVVLCSATQPPFEEEHYPMCIDANASMTGAYAQDFSNFRRTQLDFSHGKGNGYSDAEAARFAYEKLQENGSLLFVVNTKKTAQHIFQLLQKQCVGDDDIVLLHLSTKMCPAHRREIIAKMRNCLATHQKVACVSTQLIEAGVDVSFACVIRALSGLDSIAQAAGRCNRNGEFSCKTVYVMKLWEENLSHLEFIQKAQLVTESMLVNGLVADMQSVSMLTEYYRRLFYEFKSVLSYPAKDLGVSTNLLDMLSTATVRRSLCGYPNQFFFPLMRSAGAQFHVIDTHTRSVLVPYNEEAKELIWQLNGEADAETMIQALRKAQKYTVELYTGDEKKLMEHSALYSLRCGAIALEERFYDAEFYGVTIEESNMELLCF